VEAKNSARPKVAEEIKPILVREADGFLEKAQGFFQQPTAEEMSRLVFGKVRDLCVHTQAGRNHFAHLLNRGSSLE
jgi:hypothetical protein